MTVVEIVIERKRHEYSYRLLRGSEIIEPGKRVERDRAMTIVAANSDGRTDDGHAPDFRPINPASWTWRVVIVEEPIADPPPVSPVALFMELDGFGFSSSTRTATFRDPVAADRFQAAFPDWTAYAHHN